MTVAVFGCFHTVVTKLIEIINSQNVFACTAVITIIVSWNLSNFHVTVQKLLVRQVLTPEQIEVMKFEVYSV